MPRFSSGGLGHIYSEEGKLNQLSRGGPFGTVQCTAFVVYIDKCVIGVDF